MAAVTAVVVAWLDVLAGCAPVVAWLDVLAGCAPVVAWLDVLAGCAVVVAWLDVLAGCAPVIPWLDLPGMGNRRPVLSGRAVVVDKVRRVGLGRHLYRDLATER